MKISKVCILLVVFVILGFLAFKLRSNSSQSSISKTGALLSNPINLNEVNHVILSEGDEESEMKQEEGVWVLKSYFDFPVDFEKLQENLQQLLAVEDAEIRHGGEEYLSDFGLDETQATKISLVSGKEKATIVLGDQHGGTRGRFALNDEQQVLLLSDSFYALGAGKNDWINKELFRVGQEGLNYVSLTQTNFTIVINKDSEGKYALDTLKENEKLNDANTGSLFGMLARLDFSSVYGKATNSPFTEAASKAVFKTDTGITLSLTLESIEDKACLGFTLTYTKKPAPEQGELNEEEFKKQKADYEKKLKETETLVATLTSRSAWIYELSDYAVRALNFGRKDLIEIEETEKAETAEVVLPVSSDPTPVVIEAP